MADRLCRAVCATLSSLALLSACDRLRSKNTKSEDALDTSRLVTASIKPSGGTIKATDAKGTTSSVLFMPDAISKETAVEVVPLKEPLVPGAKMAVDGLLVRKKGDAPAAHFDLDGPAFVTFVVKGPASDKLTLLRYGEDGKSIVTLPTKRWSTKDGTAFQAPVMHFSGIGVGEAPAGAQPSPDSAENPWVLSVMSQIGGKGGPFNFKFRLRTVARKTDKELTFAGTYRGPATLAVRGNKTDKGVGSIFQALPTGDTEGTLEMTIESKPEADVDAVDVPLVGKGTLTLAGSATFAVTGAAGQAAAKAGQTRAAEKSTANVTLKGTAGKLWVTVTVEGMGDFRGRLHGRLPKGKCDKSKLDQNQREIVDRYKDLEKYQEKTFTTLEQANDAAVDSIRAACKGSNFEWGARICQRRDGKYTTSLGGKAGCGTDFEQEVSTTDSGCPDPMETPVASVHCHPASDQNERPSDGDLQQLELQGIDQITVLCHGGGQKDRTYTAKAGDPPNTPLTKKILP